MHNRNPKISIIECIICIICTMWSYYDHKRHNQRVMILYDFHMIFWCCCLFFLWLCTSVFNFVMFLYDVLMYCTIVVLFSHDVVRCSCDLLRCSYDVLLIFTCFMYFSEILYEAPMMLLWFSYVVLCYVLMSCMIFVWFSYVCAWLS